MAALAAMLQFDKTKKKMSTLNVNIPRFYCLLRKEFLYDGIEHVGEYVQVCVFGVASITGRALGFHVLTENGAVIWRLPINSQEQVKLYAKGTRTASDPNNSMNPD